MNRYENVIFCVEGREYTAHRGHFDALTRLYPEIPVCDLTRGDPMRYEDKIVVQMGYNIFKGTEALNVQADALSKCRFLVGIHDDPTFSPPTQIRKVIMDKPNVLVTHVQQLPLHLKGWSWAHRVEIININRLSWCPQPLKHITHKGILYYGALRRGRLQTVRRFLKGPYRVTISGSKKAIRDFDVVLPMNATFIPMFPRPLGQYIGEWEGTLYMRDEQSSMTSPGNRFYECLSARLMMCFTNSEEDFEGHDVSEWVVHDPLEVVRMLERAEIIRGQQWEAMGRVDYRRMAEDQLVELVESLL